MGRFAHAPPLACGSVPEAVQNEADEAVRNEKQASVPEYVNQDVSGTHLPATAWPMQMRPSRAEPFHGHNGKGTGGILALMQGWSEKRRCKMKSKLPCRST